MSMYIQARGFPLTNALRESVTGSLFDVFERHHQVETVDVRLEDINSREHGGIDKRCQVVVKVAHAPSIVIRSTQADMYIAIRHCASRVKKALGRLADRQSSHGH